jgi:ethanolamine utilization protein EutP (predicted NTPase)
MCSYDTPLTSLWKKIPFSGRNPRFQEMLTVVRPHILVLNKVELSDDKLLSNVEAKLLATGDIKRVLFTSCKQTSNDGIKRQVRS